jgi:hypothetical protein
MAALYQLSNSYGGQHATAHQSTSLQTPQDFAPRPRAIGRAGEVPGCTAHRTEEFLDACSSRALEDAAFQCARKLDTRQRNSPRNVTGRPCAIGLLPALHQERHT